MRITSRFPILLISSLVLVLFSACTHQPAALRLLSYNVRNCRGLDDSVSYERVAKVILESGADYVALQELDSMTERFPEQDVLGNLSRLTGMYPVFAPSIDFQGGKYGIGMLSREKPLSHCRIPLPCSSEPRSLLVVEFEDFYFCSTHLSLHAKDRVLDAQIITEQLTALKKPVLLAGDFNAQDPEEAFLLLKEKFTFLEKEGSRLTFPANGPDREIDYFCHPTSGPSSKIRVLEHKVLSEPTASDHRPLWAVVELF